MKNKEVTSFHLRAKPREFIDVLVLKGYYISRAEFIRMAIDQKIEKILNQLHDPFYQEILQEESKPKANERISIRGI